MSKTILLAPALALALALPARAMTDAKPTNRAKGLRESKDEGGQLRRTLQRLEILKDLRASEAARSRRRTRAIGATARKATGAHRAAEMKARPGRVSSALS